MIDEQHAVQMVHLMLQAGREKTFDLFLASFAVEVEPAGAYPVGAVHLGELVGHRQATLGLGHVLV